MDMKVLDGSVDKAIELFQQTSSSKKTPIRVVGSGCMGVTAAIELSKLGYEVVGISSWRAAVKLRDERKI